MESQLRGTSASNTLNYDVEVQFLVNQLLVGHSCSHAKHQELLSTRKADLDEMQENSESLEEKTNYCLVSLRRFSQNTIKCVASSANILSFDFDKSNILVGSTLREYEPYLLSTDTPNFEKLSKETCEILFEGIDRSSTSTSHLVLNTFTLQRHSRSSLQDISFDIDSFIAIPKSLAVAKCGFQVNEIFFIYFISFFFFHILNILTHLY